MTTALDTSMLLDILVDDPTYASVSESALSKARSKGSLVVCEAVIAELRPAFSSDKELSQFLNDVGIDYLPSTKECALLAGSIFSSYLKNKDKAKRVLPDFLIAAHAMINAESC